MNLLNLVGGRMPQAVVAGEAPAAAQADGVLLQTGQATPALPLAFGAALEDVVAQSVAVEAQVSDTPDTVVAQDDGKDAVSLPAADPLAAVLAAVMAAVTPRMQTPGERAVAAAESGASPAEQVGNGASAGRAQAVAQPLPAAQARDAVVAEGRFDDSLAASQAVVPLRTGKAAVQVERAVPAVASLSADAAAATTVTAPAQAAVARAAGETLRLPNGDAGQWRQPLATALGERLQVMVSNGSERAVIRLDPPMMGTIEIVVRHEAGAVQVHVSATHGEVLRQLHGLSDSLRQDPVLRQFADVSVQVADAGRDGDGRQRQRTFEQGNEDPGQALAEADAGRDALRFSMATERE